MTGPMFERAALIGLGLIGSSLSHAMRRNGLARSIVGHAQSEKTRDAALRLGLVGSVYASAAEAAMRVKSRKPPAENLITSVSVTCSRCRAVLTML